MGNVNMEASQINYRGGEKKMSVEEALKNTSGEAAAIAQLQTDVLNLNSNKANQITIAPFFSAEASYDPGDLVYYNGLSYRCVNAHEGEWDADDFAATTIAGELDSLKSGLTSRLMIAQANIEGVDFSTFVSGVFNYANGLVGDNSSIMINTYWVGQNNYTAIVYKGNSNFLYAILFCSPTIYQADYINGVTTSRQVQMIS